MRYKIYYGAKPTFTDADKRDFSRGGYECKALMKDRQNRPVVISQNKELGFPRVEGRVRFFMCAVRHI